MVQTPAGLQNPYAAPAARIAQAPPAAFATPFFAVSTPKLAVMTLATLGLYPMYWFYVNWQHVNARASQPVWPWVRAGFYPLTAHGLFARMNQQSRALGPALELSAGPLACAVLLFNLSCLLPEPYFLLSMLGFAPVVLVQAKVNQLHAAVAPSADPNARFTGWNWFGIAVGGPLLLLLLVAPFLAIES